MYTKSEIEEKVKRYIKNYRLYYINYPERDDEELFWQSDGDNEIELISELETSHLENCIKKVNKDLDNFDDKYTRDIIEPLLKNKLKYLKSEIKTRAEG